jgi:hypothetical protein
MEDKDTKKGRFCQIEDHGDGGGEGMPGGMGG